MHFSRMRPWSLRQNETALSSLLSFAPLCSPERWDRWHFQSGERLFPRHVVNHKSQMARIPPLQPAARALPRTPKPQISISIWIWFLAWSFTRFSVFLLFSSPAVAFACALFLQGTRSTRLWAWQGKRKRWGNCNGQQNKSIKGEKRRRKVHW